MLYTKAYPLFSAHFLHFMFNTYKFFYIVSLFIAKNHKLKKSKTRYYVYKKNTKNTAFKTKTKFFSVIISFIFLFILFYFNIKMPRISKDFFCFL